MPAKAAAERISRAVVVPVAGTSAVVLIVGLRYFSGTFGPLFLALVLTIAIHPLGAAITRGRILGWLELDSAARTVPADGRQPSNEPS
jgi:predicted PurR-regulated permease PerM